MTCATKGPLRHALHHRRRHQDRPADEPGGLHTVTVGGSEIKTRAVILAMGAEPKKLGVPGEDELAARGVSYCATCDAAFFRDHETLVVGGGDTAMEDATFLAKFAGKVSIVHRRDEFRASAIMLDRAKAMENIELVTLRGGALRARRERPARQGRAREHRGRVAQGNPRDRRLRGDRPPANSQLVADQLPVDDEGYLLVEGRSTKTRLPGVFAAGDLTDRVYRQAVTAAGTGCMAALDAEAYLRDTPIDPEAHWALDPDRVEAAGQAVAESATAAAQPTAR